MTLERPKRRSLKCAFSPKIRNYRNYDLSGPVRASAKKKKMPVQGRYAVGRTGA